MGASDRPRPGTESPAVVPVVLAVCPVPTVGVDDVVETIGILGVVSGVPDPLAVGMPGVPLVEGVAGWVTPTVSDVASARVVVDEDVEVVGFPVGEDSVWFVVFEASTTVGAFGVCAVLVESGFRMLS